MQEFHAYAAREAGGALEPFSFNPGPLAEDQVGIAVDYCGICHSDLSMLRNEWGQSSYPLVPGHEVAGRVVEAGARVQRVRIGDRVGLGWFSASCLSCPQCLGGDHNLCASAEQTIVGRHGGFADRVRCHWSWATPLPDALDHATAGPLFCGGITVFNPLVEFGIAPTSRIGVVGIGGLGHLAVQFANKWGCEVLAFSSDKSKAGEILNLGAHAIADSRNPESWKPLAGSLDLLLVTVNVPLDWQALIGLLAPKGRMHFVGAVLEPVPVAAFSLIGGQKSLSGTPLGSPATTSAMLAFCARHGIAPMTEVFPMSRVNEALEHLDKGKPRYRIVLKNDFGS
jgi:alcohol/geraniol dehydrogenase (NADP+)